MRQFPTKYCNFNTRSFTKAFLLLLVVNLVFSSKVLAQDHYVIDWYTDSQGLPQNIINSIFKDRYGYIWFATESGLARYDGSHFKIFNKENIKGLKNSRIGYFTGNKDRDSVYSSTRNEENLLITARHVEKIPDSSKLLIQGHQVITQQELSRYRGMLRANKVFHKNVDLDGIRRYSCDQREFVLKEDRIIEFDSSSGQEQRYVYEVIIEGQFFIYGNAFYQLDSGGNLTRFKAGKKIRIDIASQSLQDGRIFNNTVNHQVFLYMDKNLYLIEKIDPNGMHKNLLVSDFTYDPEDISALFFDTNSNYIYFGTYSKGMGIIKNLPFTTIRDTTRNADNIIYGITKINDSTFITGTGMVIQNNKMIAKAEIGRSSDKFYLAYLEESRSLWTFNLHDLYQFKLKKDYSVEQINQFGYDNDREYSMVQKRDSSSIWVAVSDRGRRASNLYIRKLKGEQSTQSKIITTDFWLTSLIPIDGDNVYLGSKKGGIYRLEHYPDQPHLKMINDTIKVRSFYRDGNHFWATTYDQGYFLLKNDSILSFPLDRQLFTKSVHAIRKDDQGFFWLPTNRGLFRVSASNLYDYSNTGKGEVFYQYFDKSYGFSTNEFNGGGYPYAVTLKNGNLYFPSLDGVVGFLPSSIQNGDEETGIYIDEIRVDNTSLPVKKKIEIPQHVERLTFTLSYPFYGSPSNVKTEARLESGEELQSWTRIGKDRTISFTNLAPGDYIVRFRKQAHLDPNYEYNEIAIHVPYLFYQTLWFKLLILLVGIALIFYFVHLWTRHNVRRRNILERKVSLRTIDLTNTVEKLRMTEDSLKKQLSFQRSMVRSISHDLRTPTKYLNLVSKQIYQNSKSPEEKESIKAIYMASDKIADFIEKLLIYAKANIREFDKNKEEINLYDFIEKCLSLFRIPLQECHNVAENRVNKDIRFYINVQVLRIIVQNLLDNAVKNTTNGVISILALEKEKTISLQIKDTGKGIHKDNLNEYRSFFEDVNLEKEISDSIGLGFKIIKQLLPYVKATIFVKSVEGEGSLFRIEIQKQKMGK